MSHSDNNSDPLSSEEEEEIGEFLQGIEPYSMEPEYSPGEVPVVLEGATAAAESVDDTVVTAEWPPAARLGNTSWCECGKCSAMPVRLDCICCREELSMLKFVEAKATDAAGRSACITTVGSFRNVCLDEDVLLTALVGYLDITKRPMGDLIADNR